MTNILPNIPKYPSSIIDSRWLSEILLFQKIYYYFPYLSTIHWNFFTTHNIVLKREDTYNCKIYWQRKLIKFLKNIKQLKKINHFLPFLKFDAIFVFLFQKMNKLSLISRWNVQWDKLKHLNIHFKFQCFLFLKIKQITIDQ